MLLKALSTSPGGHCCVAVAFSGADIVVCAAARFGTAGTYSDKNGKVPNSVKYGGRAIVKNGPCFQVIELYPSQFFSPPELVCLWYRRNIANGVNGCP